MLQQSPSEILKHCERRLQDALQRVVQSGDYATAADLARWTGQVANIAREAAEGSPALAGTGTLPSVLETGVGGGPVARAGSRKPATRLSKEGAYPKFARRDDQLIKTGWSKTEKREYQHKAPKHVAELLRSALLRAWKSGPIVSTDHLFPLKEGDGSEVPSYQAYLCLAWLRHEGLVEQEGRQGYRVKSIKSLSEPLERRWAALPTL